MSWRWGRERYTQWSSHTGGKAVPGMPRKGRLLSPETSGPKWVHFPEEVILVWARGKVIPERGAWVCKHT